MLFRAFTAILAVLCLEACSPVAIAQSALLQAGPVAAGHAPMYVNTGTSQPVVQDSGTAAGGASGVGLSELGVTGRGTGTPPYAGQGKGPLGTNICDYDAPITNATGYHYFCLSANAQGGGLIAYGHGGSATALPFNLSVNGTTYPFPFVIGGIVGPPTTVTGDAACWNNTVGTLLSDCGAPVTLAGNNTWTGSNNFTSTFKIGGTTETFPASGNLVGTTDTQALTNKSIAASEVNSGTLAAAQMPALTGDVTTSAGAVATTIAANAVTNAKAAQMATQTVKCNATASTGNAQDCAFTSVTGVYNVTSYGALCDSSTDDTTAITNAMAAVPSGGKLIFPTGRTCVVLGSGTSVFTRTTPIYIDCQGSTIALNVSTPNTRNLFTFAPTTTGTFRRWRVTNCTLAMNGVGKNTIEINTQATNTTEIGEFWIDHVTDQASGSATGYSIYVNNPITNVTGGTFDATFSDNYLLNGIYFSNAGDTLRVKDSILAGTKYGIYLNQIPGAAGVVISGNNITSANELLIDNTSSAIVDSNEFEQVVATSNPNNAQIDLNGSGGSLLVNIINNTIHEPSTGPGYIRQIYAASVASERVVIDGNGFENANTGACIVNAASGTTVGAMNSYVCTTHVTNTGALNYVQVGPAP